MAASLTVKMSWPAEAVLSIRLAERTKIKEEMSICAADAIQKEAINMQV